MIGVDYPGLRPDPAAAPRWSDRPFADSDLTPRQVGRWALYAWAALTVLGLLGVVCGGLLGASLGG